MRCAGWPSNRDVRTLIFLGLDVIPRKGTNALQDTAAQAAQALWKAWNGSASHRDFLLLQVQGLVHPSRCGLRLSVNGWPSSLSCKQESRMKSNQQRQVGKQDGTMARRRPSRSGRACHACACLSHVHCWWSCYPFLHWDCVAWKRTISPGPAPARLAHRLAGKERHRRNGESCQVGTLTHTQSRIEREQRRPFQRSREMITPISRCHSSETELLMRKLRDHSACIVDRKRFEIHDCDGRDCTEGPSLRVWLRRVDSVQQHMPLSV